jgi:hypothetical protein
MGLEVALVAAADTAKRVRNEGERQKFREIESYCSGIAGSRVFET